MNYATMLKLAIDKSGLSLAQISKELETHEISSDRTYLSKLQNGAKPPASDKLNDALAKVLSVDSLELKTAAYREKIPKDVLEHLNRIGNRKEVV